MRAFKIYATGSSTANAVAQITIPSATRVVGIQWGIAIDMVADNNQFAAEISLASASEINTNGAQQCLSEIRSYNNLVTSGMVQGAQNLFVPVDVAVKQGQIIYMHVLCTTATYAGGALVWTLR